MAAHPLVDLPALILLVVANSVPVLLSMVFGGRWAQSIDGARTWSDGRPLFGSHKTWRGFIGGTLAGGVAGVFLGLGFATGVLFAFLALAGDLLSSFIKRRLARESGRDTPFLDQIPEALLPLLFLHERLSLSIGTILGTTVLFILLDIVAARLFTFRRAPRA